MPAAKRETISLRKRLMKSGSISLYLDIYKDGKREYEYLKLYLHSKPSNTEERNQNKETLRLAQAMHAKRVIEVQNNMSGFIHSSKLDTSFLSFFRRLAETPNDDGQIDGCWYSTLAALKEYCSEELTFRDVNEAFVKGFRAFLDNYEGQYSKSKKLSRNSKSIYFTKFRAAITIAYKGKYLSENPIVNVPTIRPVDTERTYLTISQVKVLAKTECNHPLLKRAFLFSCLTGLRISDIAALKWKQIKSFEGGVRIVFKQEKTNWQEYLDISEHATKFLGERGFPDDHIFPDVHRDNHHGPRLTEWCQSAGIYESITFHSGRHTFAVMMLTLGESLYTVSKLLGHKRISTTEKYAKLVDKVKQDAVKKIPDIGI